MTAQLGAPENLKALYTDASYEPTLEEWNHLVLEGGAAYKSELSARTVFESELFGMNTYILMSMMEDYLRVPERLRTIREHATPAELVRRALPIGNKRSFINLAAMPLHYLTGRELFVDLAENTLADGLEDQLEVLRFWREATIAMRTDGVLFNMDAEPANSSHVVGDQLLAEIREHLVPADEQVKTAIRKFGARLTAYAFLENCDARTAVCDTGPYELEDGTFLALRETCTVGDGDFPWLDGIRETLPHHHFVIAYRLPGHVTMDNNVWGTAWFTPSDYQADIIETRVFCTDGDVLRPLGLAEIDEATTAIRKAHRALYQRLAETDPEERNLYATHMTRGRPRPGHGSPAATTRSTGRSRRASPSPTSGSPIRTPHCGSSAGSSCPRTATAASGPCRRPHWGVESMSLIGKGTPSYTFTRTTGLVRWFREPQDVIDSLDTDLESTVALVASGGTTFLSPILGRLAGIVCLDGTLRSHLAIVSREFEVPCLVGTDLTADLTDGTEIVLDIEDGAGVVRAGSEPAQAPAVADVSAAWWSYVRRVGDEIAVKDFDVTVSPEALDALLAEELTDDRLDDLVQHMGRAFKSEMTRRPGFTSELFPMLPYMSLSVIEDFHSYAERVAVIEAAMPAEEIGRRLREGRTGSARCGSG